MSIMKSIVLFHIPIVNYESMINLKDSRPPKPYKNRLVSIIEPMFSTLNIESGTIINPMCAKNITR